jgi:hypothetical protein
MVTPKNGLPENGTPNGALHVCPTRIDRAPVLFAHKLSGPQCQDRQRGHYHKCFTCAWNNAWLALHGKPVEGAAVERRSFVRAG